MERMRLTRHARRVAAGLCARGQDEYVAIDQDPQCRRPLKRSPNRSGRRVIR
jgi:hypothetical protein